MVRASDLGLFLRMIISTGVVLGILLSLAQLAKRGRLDGVLSRVRGGGGVSRGARRVSNRAENATALDVLSRTAVTRESSLLHLRFGGEEILVAVGQHGASVISRIDAEHTATEAAPSFEERLSEARLAGDVEEALAGTLVTGSLVERLRHATSRTAVPPRETTR